MRKKIYDKENKDGEEEECDKVYKSEDNRKIYDMKI